MAPESGTTKSGCTQGIRLTTVSQVVDRIVLEFGFVLFVVKLFFVVNPARVRGAHSNDPGYYRDFQQHPVTAGNPLDSVFSGCLLVCTKKHRARL